VAVLDRAALRPIIIDAIKSNGGSATVTEVAKYIWTNYESDLRASGDFFFVWQYDMRRAAETLRNRGDLKPWDKRLMMWEVA
jgi:hypothetical protein